MRQRGASNLCRLVELGLVDYSFAYEFQKESLNKIRHSGGPDTLIFCQHPHTITQGRTSKKENILVSQSKLQQKEIKLYEIDRGGDVTYHGPGQLVVYPILDLEHFKKDLKYFLRSLEEVIIRFLRLYNISAERRCGYTGVWVDGEKIASIGIAVKKWIAYHGIAININPDLKYFSFIRPCGLDVEMTSISKIFNRKINIDEQSKLNLSDKFKEVFNMEIAKEENYEKSIAS